MQGPLSKWPGQCQSEGGLEKSQIPVKTVYGQKQSYIQMQLPKAKLVEMRNNMLKEPHNMD